jgi:tetratricopeptide (TPR) repeat protein
LLDAAGHQAGDAEKLLRKAIERFETERRSVMSGPTWGEADAYLALGRIRLAKGEVLPARDALERALLVAPEFAAARKLLSEITSR